MAWQLTESCSRDHGRNETRGPEERQSTLLWSSQQTITGQYQPASQWHHPTGHWACPCPSHFHPESLSLTSLLNIATHSVSLAEFSSPWSLLLIYKHQNTPGLHPWASLLHQFSLPSWSHPHCKDHVTVTLKFVTSGTSSWFETHTQMSFR